MKLYFSPLACSLAARITLYEADASNVSFVEVDPKTKKTRPSDGSPSIDFATIHPLGLVPALELDDGQVLAENAAVLQYLGDRFPEARLIPRDSFGRARLQQWLCFFGTELHKALFVPLLDPRASKEARTYALSKETSRLGWLDRELAGKTYVLDDFSVADAYLFAILNWSAVTPVSLRKYPAIADYHKRLRERPSIARAYGEERTLYAKELARHALGHVHDALFGGNPARESA
jgi:glutathione S-transferase